MSGSMGAASGSGGVATESGGAAGSTGGLGGGSGPAGSGGSGGGTGGALVDGGVVVDSGCPTPALCAVKTALIHRYSFSGSGTTVTDSVGTANGTVVNGQLSGSGEADLRENTDQYVDLPNGIVKSLTNATFEAWLTWAGGAGWQRLFDFGDSDGPENTQGFAASSFYLSPQGAGPTSMIVALKRADQAAMNETRAVSTQALAPNVVTHLVVVIDSVNGKMTVYRDGAIDVSVAFQGSLSTLNDVNNWLGRSQYKNDPAFQGTIDEFRIYRAALSAAQVQASFVQGPDAPF